MFFSSFINLLVQETQETSLHGKICCCCHSPFGTLHPFSHQPFCRRDSTNSKPVVLGFLFSEQYIHSLFTFQNTFTFSSHTKLTCIVMSINRKKRISSNLVNDASNLNLARVTGATAKERLVTYWFGTAKFKKHSTLLWPWAHCLCLQSPFSLERRFAQTFCPQLAKWNNFFFLWVGGGGG